jgi:hypothetical protein
MSTTNERPIQSNDACSESLELQASLVEYAERLLQSTGLSAHDALLIASGQMDPPEGIESLGRALRAGWQADRDVEVVEK